MSVGYPATKADFDARAGTLAKAVRDDLAQCSQFCALLQSAQWTDANLVLLGYTQAEVTLLKAAFTDLGGTGTSLYQLGHGAATLPSANDFFFNAKLLCGVT